MNRALLVLALVSPAGLLTAVGCFGSYCDENPENCNGDSGGSGGAGGATTSSMMTTTSSTTQSATTGLPMECDPLALMAGQSLDATCGVFVNPAGPSGDGSQAMPFATLAEALTNNPDNRPIFVCATSESLDEPVTLMANERLVGGLDCGNWQASSTKTPWTSAENSIPLTLDGTSGAHIQGFAITARDAAGFDVGTLDGNDSIAVAADGATATLLQVDVVAGAGAAGGNGEDQMGQAPGRQSDAMGFDGNDGGDCAQPAGTEKVFSACPTGGSTSGGVGGLGGQNSGQSGLDGAPDPGLGDPNGEPGIGEPSMGVFSCGGQGDGETGHDGPAGSFGAAGSTGGALSPTGFAGLAAGDGMPGTIGQGGGGGGGRKGNGSNNCGANIAGPSGGSGGAGGCGGLAGGGAGQGGASIAVLSIASSLAFTDVSLRAVAGGVGGEGGDGQIGGNGGNGGNGGGNACGGGDGGAGGLGGPGGGGAGGASIGIAFSGIEPSISMDAITVAGTAALGGDGGNANASANGGAAGLTVKTQTF